MLLLFFLQEIRVYQNRASKALNMNAKQLTDFPMSVLILFVTVDCVAEINYAVSMVIVMNPCLMALILKIVNVYVMKISEVRPIIINSPQIFTISIIISHKFRNNSFKEPNQNCNPEVILR